MFSYTHRYSLEVVLCYLEVMATAVDVLAQVVAVLDINVGYDIVHELSLRQGCLGQRTMGSVYGDFLETVSSFRGDDLGAGVVLTIEPCESCDDRGNDAEAPTLLDVAVIIANGGEKLVLHDGGVPITVSTCLELVGAGTKKCQQ